MTPSFDPLQKACLLLKQGKAVSIPTETVYGLGVNACNDDAVAGIYELKKRPQFNPLIAHFPSIQSMLPFVKISPLARKLGKAFWPGSLTLVLPLQETSAVSKLVTAGLPTLAVRIPNHPLTLSLLEICDFPIAAPSANPSGQLSPTTAQQVRDSFGSSSPFIIDGGPCTVGVESTILDLSGTKPILLRSGGIPLETLESFLGEDLKQDLTPTSPKAPGQLSRHYAPKALLRLNCHAVKEEEALLAFGTAVAHSGRCLNLSPTEDLKEAATHLFSALHLLDQEGHKKIAVMPIPNEGLGLAINDRLKRASVNKED